MSLPGPRDPVLVFDTGADTYALSAALVQGTVALPRLTPLQDTPPWVIGGFELDGDLVPLVSLPVLAGQAAPPARIQDQAIIVRAGQATIACHAQGLLALTPAVSPGAPAIAGLDTQSGGPRTIGVAGRPATWLDPASIQLTRDPEPSDIADPDPGDARLIAFERQLDHRERQRMNRRARFCAEHATGAAEPRVVHLRVRIQRCRLALLGTRCAGFLTAPSGNPAAAATGRGEQLRVIDPRPALDAAVDPAWHPRGLVLLRGTAEPMALAVDAVERLIAVPVTRSPGDDPARPGALGHRLAGTLPDDDDLLPLLDPLVFLSAGASAAAAADIPLPAADDNGMEASSTQGQPDLAPRDRD